MDNEKTLHFTSPEDFTQYLFKRYGMEIGRVIRNAIEYTGDSTNPVVYKYWEHDGTPSNITFYKSLADAEYPNAIQESEETNEG
jgi:hypothetical protein